MSSKTCKSAGQQRDSGLGISLEELLKQKANGPAFMAPVASDHERADGFFAEGVRLLKENDPFAALKPLFAALALESSHMRAANNLVVAFWQLGFPPLAKKMATEILKIDPDNERAQKHLEFLAGEEEIQEPAF